MTVTWNKYASQRLAVDPDNELFSIHESTQRGNHSALVRTSLPGCRVDSTFHDDADSFSANAAVAYEACARAYERWLADNAGVTATVVIDSTAVR